MRYGIDTEKLEEFSAQIQTRAAHEVQRKKMKQQKILSEVRSDIVGDFINLAW